MRKQLFVPALVAVLIAATPFFASVTKYDIDAAHSNIGFSIPLAGGLSHLRGKFTEFTVTIIYDDKDVTRSSVEAVIKSASIDTGIEERDAHLRKPDFFDVEKYPEITFKSSRIEKIGKDFIAHGTFTMHGVSREMAIPFTVNGVNRDEKTGKTVLGATGRTTVKRRDYSINYIPARPYDTTFLGDAVEIELSLITRAASPQ
ncbi:MAG: YceI family protein [Pyrinomonadaceae bacterium]|nr:YceI family protein [Pyrinomonadaceae bacterium]